MDRRDRVREEASWHQRLDMNKMVTIMVLWNDEGEEEEHEVPIKMEVCGTCDGKGKHVNPSIDAHGISAEEFYEDPDFADEYFSGTYDVTCYECHGNNVVAVMDEDALKRSDPELLKRIEEFWEDQANDRAERDAERRFGC